MNPTVSAIAPRPTVRLCGALSALCLALMLVWPVFTLLVLTLSPEKSTAGLSISPADGSAFPLDLFDRIVIVVFGLIPALCAAWGLVRARRCFRSFARGDYFSADVVGNLRAFAAGIALWVATDWLATPVLSVLLTLSEETKTLSVGFNMNLFMTLLFAGIVWLIADIMQRAAAIAEENQQFV